MGKRVNRKKISVCMAVYNGKNYIEEQLVSLYNQSRKADEVVICDDNSADNTAEIVKNFIKEHRLEGQWHLYHNNVTKGYPSNFYHAMSLCQGDIIFLADQDDVWKEKKIEEMFQVMEQEKAVLLLASAWQVMDKNGKIFGRESRRGNSDINTENISVSQIFYRYLWPGMSMCYRKELGKKVLEKAGDTKLAHDVALALCAAQEGGFKYINSSLQYHRNHAENLAMEEQRFWKLLNRTRKIIEIQRYLDMLSQIINNSIMQGEYKEIALCKQKIMQERLQNLKKRSIIKIIRQYLSNKEMICISTVICDCIICFGKIDREL